MPQLVKKPNSRVYHDVALTKVKKWFMIRIQGLTLNKSCSLVGVLQTLFKEQDPKHLGNLSNRGSNIQLIAVSYTKNYSKSWRCYSMSMVIGASRSRVFVKQLELIL
jgi:hypothetical protein